MSCVLNSNRFLIPNDAIVSLTSIYKWIGKNDQFKSMVGNDYNRIVDQTIERDAYFLSQILKLDLSDARTRLIITKDSSPRTKEETTLYHIKETLAMIQEKHDSMRFTSNDMLNLVNYVFSHYKDIKYDYVQPDKKSNLTSHTMQSKRIQVDSILKELETIITNKSFDVLTLYLHLFIDMINIEPYTNKNIAANYLFLYLAILKSGLTCFHYISFFELLYEHIDEFKLELKNASFNWNEGFAQTLSFLRFMYRFFIKGYEKTYSILKELEMESSVTKADNLEQTIINMIDVFTKEELRLIHPYVSESTINRALSKLRDQGFIKPLSKGRSAKWIRVYRGATDVKK